MAQNCPRDCNRGSSIAGTNGKGRGNIYACSVCYTRWTDDDSKTNRGSEAMFAFDRCANPKCATSTGIHDGLTFGSGELDDSGYWSEPCGKCARAHESTDKDHEACWPFAQFILLSHMDTDGFVSKFFTMFDPFDKTNTRYTVIGYADTVADAQMQLYGCAVTTEKP